MPVVVASARTEIAGFLESLIFVYVLIIIAYIVTSLIFSFGVRIPYSRPPTVLLGFLRAGPEPWLRVFRPLPLRIGPLDLTPIVAILALQIGGDIVVTLIRGGGPRPPPGRCGAPSCSPSASSRPTRRSRPSCARRSTSATGARSFRSSTSSTSA